MIIARDCIVQAHYGTSWCAKLTAWPDKPHGRSTSFPADAWRTYSCTLLILLWLLLQYYHTDSTVLPHHWLLYIAVASTIGSISDCNVIICPCPGPPKLKPQIQGQVSSAAPRTRSIRGDHLITRPMHYTIPHANFIPSWQETCPPIQIWPEALIQADAVVMLLDCCG